MAKNSKQIWWNIWIIKIRKHFSIKKRTWNEVNNYILKCFVLIDLKVNEVEHKDVGQIITYLNYFNSEIIDETDNETIGIILASEKDDVFVEYATATVSNKLAIGEYQLYLPDKKI